MLLPNASNLFYVVFSFSIHLEKSLPFSVYIIRAILVFVLVPFIKRVWYAGVVFADNALVAVTKFKNTFHRYR